jgi:3-oxoacyl-[acyl-carrier protein] reductase
MTGSGPVERPTALVTGAGRELGIATATALRLADSGWNIAFTYFTPYDARMPWGADDSAAGALLGKLHDRGALAHGIEADFGNVDTPASVFEAAERAVGPISALILGHAESVDSTILGTSLESFDRHFAVNARAGWLLVREFGRRFAGPAGTGRIVALTSDHTAGNLPYGASKGALDRIVLAAAREFSALGITANCVNPGPVDNGWMDDDLKIWVRNQTPLGRLGLPGDAANLIAFLCSPEGGWINGQLLSSDGGFTAKG